MARQVAKQTLDKLGKRQGVYVKRQPPAPKVEAKVEHKAPPAIPEKFLETLVNALAATLDSHEKTQVTIAKALSQLSQESDLDITVTEHDGNGRIRRLSIHRTRH